MMKNSSLHPYVLSICSIGSKTVPEHDATNTMLNSRCHFPGVGFSPLLLRTGDCFQTCEISLSNDHKTFQEKAFYLSVSSAANFVKLEAVNC